MDPDEPRRNQEAPSIAVAPVAGMGTAVVLVVLIAAATGWAALSTDAAPDDSDSFRQQTVFAGLAYGLFGGVVWWSSFVRRQWARWTVVAFCGGLLVAWLSWRHGRPVVRYVSFFAGMAISQSCLFWFTKVPSWAQDPRIQKANPDRVLARKTRQYSLVDLVAMTLAVALLIAASQRYQSNHTWDPGRSMNAATESGFESVDMHSADPDSLNRWSTYWVGVFVVWLWLPVLSFCIARLACCQSWWSGLVSILLSLLVAGVGSVVMAALQVHWLGLPTIELATVAGDYGTFIVLYAYLFGGLAIAGRWDSLPAGSKR